jgi:hypothetical protein
MPQSAAAKLTLHGHPASRFAFVQEWWHRSEARISIYALIVTASTAFALGRRRTRDAIDLAVPALACVAIVVLFMIYNPEERMPWYYAAPQFLLVLGAAVGVLSWVRGSRWRLVPIVAGLALGATLPQNLERSTQFCRGLLDFIRLAEPERIAVGQYIHDHAAPDDRLVAGHGYVARYAGIYVYDASSLNSREVADLMRQDKSPIEELHPDWIARYQYFAANRQRSGGYTLARTFYLRSLRGQRAWRIWHRAEGPVTVFVRRDEVETDGQVQLLSSPEVPPGLGIVDATWVEFGWSGRTPEALVMGIERSDRAFELNAIQNDGADFATYTVPAIEENDLVQGRVLELTIPIVTNATSIRVILDDVAGPDSMSLLEPVWSTLDHSR